MKLGIISFGVGWIWSDYLNIKMLFLCNLLYFFIIIHLDWSGFKFPIQFILDVQDCCRSFPSPLCPYMVKITAHISGCWTSSTAFSNLMDSGHPCSRLFGLTAHNNTHTHTHSENVCSRYNQNSPDRPWQPWHRMKPRRMLGQTVPPRNIIFSSSSGNIGAQRRASCGPASVCLPCCLFVHLFESADCGAASSLRL